MQLSRFGDEGLRTHGALADRIGDFGRPWTFEIRPQHEQVVSIHPALQWTRTPGPGASSQRLQLPLSLREHAVIRKDQARAGSTGEAVRASLSAAANLPPARRLSDRPDAGELKALARHLGTLTTHLLDAARAIDQGITTEANHAACGEAKTLHRIAECLADLAATVDALPPPADDACANLTADCRDRMDRCYAALYLVVHEVMAGGWFEVDKPFFTTVFPEPQARYYASRATLDRQRQGEMWATSISLQRWAGLRGPGLGLKRGNVIGTFGLSVGPVGSAASSMKHDVRLNFALHSKGSERRDAMASALKRLRKGTDEERAVKAADALHTLVEHHILRVERAIAHCGASKTDPEGAWTPADDVLQFFGTEYLGLLSHAQRNDLFARLQGPYAPVEGTAFHAALHARGWRAAPAR